MLSQSEAYEIIEIKEIFMLMITTNDLVGVMVPFGTNELWIVNRYVTLSHKQYS